MIDLTIDLRGEKELARKFQLTPTMLYTLSVEMLETSVVAMVRRAKGFAPRGATGNLRRAIYGGLVAGTAGRGRGASAFVDIKRGDGSRTDASMYAGYVEYGTSKMDARPYMRPAAEAERQYLPQRLRKLGRRLEAEVRAA